MKCVESTDARFLLFIYGLWKDTLVPPTVVYRMGGQLLSDELEYTWGSGRPLSQNFFVVREEN